MLANRQLGLVVQLMRCLKLLPLLDVLFRFHFSLHQHSKLDFVPVIDSADSLDNGQRASGAYLLETAFIFLRVNRDVDRVGRDVWRRKIRTRDFFSLRLIQVDVENGRTDRAEVWYENSRLLHSRMLPIVTRGLSSSSS